MRLSRPFVVTRSGASRPALVVPPLLLVMILAGCGLFGGRSRYEPRMTRETAEIELFQVRHFCAPSVTRSFCDSGYATYNRGSIVMWDGYATPDENRGEIATINGRALEPYYDIHGGPHTRVIGDSAPPTVILCDGRYNYIDVRPYGGMPGIRDSIRMAAAIDLLSPAMFDTVSREGIIVRWNPVPGDSAMLLMYCQRNSMDGKGTWTVDPRTGRFVIPSTDLRTFKGDEHYTVSLRFAEYVYGTSDGRAYRMRCLCHDDHLVWLR